jgi:hypothetical protein
VPDGIEISTVSAGADVLLNRIFANFSYFQQTFSGFQ